MTCEAFEAQLPQLLTGSTTAVRAMQQHMQACATCRAEYESLCGTLKQLDAWQDIAAPLDPAQLREQAHAARRDGQPTPGQRARRWLASAAVGLAAGLLLFAGLTAMNTTFYNTDSGWALTFGSAAVPRQLTDDKLVEALESVSSTMVALQSRHAAQNTELVRAIDALLARNRSGFGDMGALALGERDTR